MLLLKNNKCIKIINGHTNNTGGMECDRYMRAGGAYININLSNVLAV
jgi:hypothetical protein